MIANSNFNLRYDQPTGGTVLVVDPDASEDSTLGGQLEVLGSAQTGSFLGEVAIADAGVPAGLARLPERLLHARPGTRPSRPAGAGLIVASRSNQTIYRMTMGADGSLTCGDGCPFRVPIDRLDPYGISLACSDRAPGVARRPTPSSPTSRRPTTWAGSPG